MKRQGDLQHEYSGNDCFQLKGHEAHTEVASLLEYLKICMFYSKKTFSAFLKFGGYNQEDVLIHKARARLMQPSFALVRDEKSKCFLLFIRGAISTKERLTAAAASEVPFHHIVLSEGQISNVVLGYAHCGMLAAARWIANLGMPHLHKAVQKFPDYQIKIIGHSMGAGIGAILTYILHEHHEFSSCACLAFAPPACMTWELAESGKEFITSLVNRNDVVPAFSKVSAENLRAEVMVSSKLDDAQDQTHLSLFATISKRVAFIKSHMLPVSYPTGKGTDPDSSISEPLLKHVAETTHPETNGLNRDCYQHRTDHNSIPEEDFSAVSIVTAEEKIVLACSDDATSINFVAGLGFAPQGDVNINGALDTEQEQSSLTGKEEQESLKQNGDGKHKQKEPQPTCSSRQFFPPGRIIHMVAMASPESNPGEGSSSNEIISIYETPRDLYGKIRLAPNMIKEHYMPSYISTMESLLEQLLKDDNVDTVTNDL
uniref:Fungal lipase-type domain-containing protein n=2 Tax=Oryza brachyantha TaxID=4533 RepID=J3LUF5_ORYBR